jgi:membrane protein DedA with SNARE-associated domain
LCSVHLHVGVHDPRDHIHVCLALVVFAATADASSCYFLSKLVGKPLVFSLWRMFFQKHVTFETAFCYDYYKLFHVMFGRSLVSFGRRSNSIP